MTDHALKTCVDAIQDAFGSDFPKVALQLGSGVNSVAEVLEDATILPYADIPGFPQPSVEGHEGRLLVGRFGGAPVACLQGRVHFYEGQGMGPAVTIVRALALLGVETLILTNAAGSLREDMPPGSLMAITDHINLSGGNPLIGINDDAFGPRFPDMTDAWDPALREILHAAAKDEDIPLYDGVYLMVTGPSFETPAEIRAFRILGADAVGMSTAHECIIARHAGLRVVGVSTITNLAAGMSGVPLTHGETMDVGVRAAEGLAKILAGFVERLAAE